MSITDQALGLAFPDVPGFKGQGWSSQETVMVVRWLLASPEAWDQAMDTARQYPGNPHTVADTLHERIVPRSELDAIVTAGGDPAKVNWLEIAHELIERRNDPQPTQEHAGIAAQALVLTGDGHGRHVPGTPDEWEHGYVPLTPAAAASHFKGKTPKDWKAPGGGEAPEAKAEIKPQHQYAHPDTAQHEVAVRQAVRADDYDAALDHLRQMDKLERQAKVGKDEGARPMIAKTAGQMKLLRQGKVAEYKRIPKDREQLAGKIAATAGQVITGASPYIKTTPEQAEHVKSSLGKAADSLRAGDSAGALRHLADAKEAAKGPGGTSVLTGGAEGRGAVQRAAAHERDVQALADRTQGLAKYALAGDTITAQILDLAASVTVAPGAMKPPGLPVPDDPAAISIFTAHRVNSILHQVAHAVERMQAAKAASGDLRAYHVTHIAEHLQRALDSGHEMTVNLREHYPAEAAELDAVKESVGLAKAVSETAKAVTTAHLTETTLHELTHAALHAQAMGKDDPDGDEWAFDADHCEKHLGGAVEHAGKIWTHLHDNYPRESKWLTGIAAITHPLEAQQHANSGTVSAQMANPETITGQLP
jgi:hypothetical protein